MENIDLSKKLKELRFKKALSQEQLAEISGLSLRTIQRLESGETVPRGDTLKNLAIALQVTPDEIIDWKIVEDRNVLKILNLSQLGFLVFPLLGIIIPLSIWILKKEQIKNVDELGKSIINFQITWTLSFFTILILSYVIRSLVILVLIMYLINGIVIIINAIKLNRTDRIISQPAISFLK